MSHLVADCGSLHSVKLLECDFLLVPHTQVWLGMWLLWVVSRQEFPILSSLFDNNINFQCYFHFSHGRGWRDIAFTQIASICRGVFLESVADCAILYCWTASFLNWATIDYYLLELGNCGSIAKLPSLNENFTFEIGYSRRKWLLCF